KKVSKDSVKLCETTQVKLKTAGNTQVVQFTAGNRYQSPKSVRKSLNRLMVSKRFWLLSYS
ncbi:MAG: hypothetical protein IKK33_15755, partial [Lachnospiraceae bacterium]|nr:hypothetical protein [Lachnospiraceae bacterium]